MITNKFILFTGPSGVGKATIEKYLFSDKDLNLHLSCSATTRKPRKGEKNGSHYYFLSKDEFDKKIENNEFIEWNSHFSNKYGTLKSEITKIQNDGKIPFLEIETVGAKNIIDKFGQDSVLSFFISPPSIKDAIQRLKDRGTEDEKQIKERISRIEEELKDIDLFQHNIINDNLEKTVAEIKSIILREF